MCPGKGESIVGELGQGRDSHFPRLKCLLIAVNWVTGITGSSELTEQQFRNVPSYFFGALRTTSRGSGEPLSTVSLILLYHFDMFYIEPYIFGHNFKFTLALCSVYP